jgi:peptide-methionine (S)-S-oxide reductase
MIKRKMLSLLVSFLAAATLVSAASKVFPEPAVDVPASGGTQVAVFAGGCFWGIEGVFERVKGVKQAVAGYSGGEKSTAHYEMVSEGNTGHAESVQVTFDPNQISYGQLLKIFFSVAHDPTEKDHQGPDWGTQYRSAIFYANDEQKKAAEAYIKQLEDAGIYSHRIVTQVVPLKAFYAAEPHHQHYLELHPDQPYIVYNDLPKIAELKKHYPELCKR